jgi:hypothetical protein
MCLFVAIFSDSTFVRLLAFGMMVAIILRIVLMTRSRTPLTREEQKAISRVLRVRKSVSYSAGGLAAAASTSFGVGLASAFGTRRARIQAEVHSYRELCRRAIRASDSRAVERVRSRAFAMSSFERPRSRPDDVLICLYDGRHYVVRVTFHDVRSPDSEVIVFGLPTEEKAACRLLDDLLESTTGY